MARQRGHGWLDQDSATEGRLLMERTMKISRVSATLGTVWVTATNKAVPRWDDERRYRWDGRGYLGHGHYLAKVGNGRPRRRRAEPRPPKKAPAAVPPPKAKTKAPPRKAKARAPAHKTPPREAAPSIAAQLRQIGEHISLAERQLRARTAGEDGDFGRVDTATLSADAAGKALRRLRGRGGQQIPKLRRRLRKVRATLRAVRRVQRTAGARGECQVSPHRRQRTPRRSRRSGRWRTGSGQGAYPIGSYWRRCPPRDDQGRFTSE